MNNHRSFRDNVVRIAALIGLILVLILGAWGAILLALNLPSIASTAGNSIISLFSNTHGTSTTPTNNTVETIAVSAPASVTSGSSLVVSWNGSASRDYTVSYACQNGLSFKVLASNGAYQTVPCATAFNYVSPTNKMTLVPTVTGSETKVATIVVTATEGEGSDVVVASGSTVVNVMPASAGSNTNTSTGGTTYVPAPRTTNLYGSADLAVRITSINSLSSQYGRVSVVFEVSNVGTNVAPAGWVLNANLPVGYSYLYTSGTQQALYPGDKIVFTLGYNSAVNNQYCSTQYVNSNCPWYNQPYRPYPYQGICYRYDGYQNIPVACPDSINPNYDYYNNLSGGYNYQYSYGSGYNYSYYNGRMVTITIDPTNRVNDYNRANNTASISSPIGY